MIENKRIYLWDNLKFLLIITVVVGHFLSEQLDATGFRPLSLFIYSFHMPAFIFISGLFYNDKNISKKVFAYLGIGLLLKVTIHFEKTLLGYSPNLSIFTTDGIPWFLFALAVFYLIRYLLKNCDKKMVIVFAFLLACFAGYDKQIGDYLVLSRIIIYFPFFYIGSIINKGKIMSFRKDNKKWLIPLSIIIILGWALICVLYKNDIYFLRKLFTGRNSFAENYFVYGPLFRLLCYIITSLMIISLINVVPDKKIKFISTFGTRTIQVYFYHKIIIYLLTCLTPILVLCNSFIGEMLYILIAIILTFALSLKIFSFPTKQILDNVKK